MEKPDEENAIEYRKAADKVWELAKEYERRGMFDLSRAIKTLSAQLHDLSREKR